MKKLIKKWWFSVVCYLAMIILLAYLIFGYIFYSNDDGFIYGLLFMSASTPIFLLFILGSANMPRKDDKNESNND